MKKKSIDHTQLLLLKLLAGEDMYGYHFVQEVVAVAQALERAAPQVDARLFQPLIGQRFIKAHHHKVGLRFGQRDARLKEALP